MTDADSANNTSPANRRGLLALVIFLGVLLLLALGALVGGLLLGTGLGGGARDGEYITSIPVAAGAQITESELDGNRLLLRIEGSQTVLVVLETTTGRVIGRVELDHAP